MNARFVKPLDRDLICALAQKTGRIITIEENILAGGFGSAVLEMINEEGFAKTIQVSRMGIPDTFSPAGSQEKVRGLYGLTPKGIARFCRGVVAPTKLC